MFFCVLILGININSSQDSRSSSSEGLRREDNDLMAKQLILQIKDLSKFWTKDQRLQALIVTPESLAQPNDVAEWQKKQAELFFLDNCLDMATLDIDQNNNKELQDIFTKLKACWKVIKDLQDLRTDHLVVNNQKMLTQEACEVYSDLFWHGIYLQAKIRQILKRKH